MPSLAAANCQQAVNQTVSGVLVRSKMVPAVTEVRRPQPEHSYRPSPSRQPPWPHSGRGSPPASAATPGSPGSPRRRRTRPGTPRSPPDSAGRPLGVRPSPEPTELLRLDGYPRGDYSGPGPRVVIG